MYNYIDVTDYSKLKFYWFKTFFPIVTIMDLGMIKELLSNKFQPIKKKKHPLPFIKLLGAGMQIHDGENWAKRRRIICHAFNVEKLKFWMTSISLCCDEMISRWEDLTSVEQSCKLDFWQEFFRFSGDVMAHATFGNNYKEGKHIVELQGEQSELVLQDCWDIHLFGYSLLPTKKNRRRRAIYREVMSLLKNMIEQRQHAFRHGKCHDDDLLGLLIESNQKYCNENPNHVGLNTEDISEECKELCFIGQVLVGALLTWTMVVLSMHPVWQKRARDEIFQVFNHNKPDFEGLGRLKIVTMILYEILRLYPPVVSGIRETYGEVKLGAYNLPAGVILRIPILLIHHSPEYWGEDVGEFNPERFAEGISNATKDQLIFFPFGWGARNCFAQSFALTEAKMALTTILQHFSFELSPSYVHEPYLRYSIWPRFGAHLILHKLKKVHAIDIDMAV